MLLNQQVALNHARLQPRLEPACDGRQSALHIAYIMIAFGVLLAASHLAEAASHLAGGFPLSDRSSLCGHVSRIHLVPH